MYKAVHSKLRLNWLSGVSRDNSERLGGGFNEEGSCVVCGGKAILHARADWVKKVIRASVSLSLIMKAEKRPLILLIGWQSCVSFPLSS